MAFPFQDYQKATQEAYEIIKDRDEKGRNDAAPDFYSEVEWPHGKQDITFELSRRVRRILGAEKRGKIDTMRGDAIDLANYALFLVMLIDKDRLTRPSDAENPLA